MPLALPPTIRTEIERPQGRSALLWLVEIELDPGTTTLPPVLLRICEGQQQIEWPLGHPSGPVIWYPLPFALSSIDQTSEGDLPSLDLSIDNTTGALMPFLHATNGLEGNQAILWQVPTSGLSVGWPNHEFRGPLEVNVASASATESAVTFRLAMPNWFSVRNPNERYVGTKCKHTFGSAECGYVINEFAAFTRCPKMVGPCAARGADLAARGLPEVLPGNFGGHPGISRRRV